MGLVEVDIVAGKFAGLLVLVALCFVVAVLEDKLVGFCLVSICLILQSL